MGKTIDKIIISSIAPKNTNVLWYNGTELKIFKKGVWKNANSPMNSELMERVILTLDNHKDAVLEFTQDSAANLELLKTLDINTNYICNYRTSDAEVIHGTYYNGTIAGFYNSKLTIWDINFDTGVVYISKQIDPDFIATRVVLDVCSPGTQEAQLNLERLRATLGGHFYCDIDHGLGVGTFQDGVGGYAHITTAYGVDTYYNIAEDGSITLDTSKKSLMERVEALEQIIL